MPVHVQRSSQQAVPTDAATLLRRLLAFGSSGVRALSPCLLLCPARCCTLFTKYAVNRTLQGCYVGGALSLCQVHWLGRAEELHSRGVTGPGTALLQGSSMAGVAVLGNGTAAPLSLQAVPRSCGGEEPAQASDAFEVVARSPDLAVLAAAHGCLRWRLRQASGQVCSHLIDWPCICTLLLLPWEHITLSRQSA